MALLAKKGLRKDGKLICKLKSEEAVADCLYQRSEGFRIEYNIFAEVIFVNAVTARGSVKFLPAV